MNKQSLTTLFTEDTVPNSQSEPKRGPGKIAVRPARVPLGLSVQMLADERFGRLDEEAFAGTVLRLSANESSLSEALGETSTIHSEGQKPNVVAIAQQLSHIGKVQEAESILREAILVQRSRTGHGHQSLMRLQSALGSLLFLQGHIGEARRLLLSCVETQRQRVGADHVDTLETLESLAMLLIAQDELSYAEPLLCEAVLIRRRTQGDTHVDTLRSLTKLANLLDQQQKPQAAEPLLRQVLAVQRRILGEQHVDSLATMGQLAKVLQSLGNIADSEALFARVLKLVRQNLGEAHLTSLSAALDLAKFLMAQKRYADARPYLDRALTLATEMGGGTLFFADDVQATLGLCLVRLKAFERAEALLVPTFERLKDSLGLLHPRTQATLSALVALFAAWGKPKEAAPYRAQHAACS